MFIKTLSCTTVATLLLVSIATTGANASSQSNTTNSPNNIILTGKNGQDLPVGDMLTMFGWMEDGCIGDGRIYNIIKENNMNFIKRTMRVRELTEPNVYDEYYDFSITPRSQWGAGYSPLIQDINMQSNSEYTKYHIEFADGVKYREEPIAEYHYKFRPESEGGEYVLMFSPNANVNDVWSHFKTRETLDWEGENLIEQKAKLDRANNTITCYF